MKQFKNTIVIATLFFTSITLYAQDDDQGGSNIQNLTPSKLIGKGQWDIKLFNNLYTQDDSTFESEKGIRQNFFTSTLEVFTGVSDTRRVNVGLIAEYRANGRDFLQDDGSFERRNTSGLTSIAPSIKFVPFENVGNFSILSSLSIPLVSNENDEDTGSDGSFKSPLRSVVVSSISASPDWSFARIRAFQMSIDHRAPGARDEKRHRLCKRRLHSRSR